MCYTHKYNLNYIFKLNQVFSYKKKHILIYYMHLVNQNKMENKYISMEIKLIAENITLTKNMTKLRPLKKNVYIYNNI